MSKPMELTIYPHLIMKAHHRGPAPYLDMEDGTLTSEHAANMLAGAKRLTEPELAADYWAMIAHFNKVQWAELASGEPVKESIWDTLAHRNATMYRFATHPHYFEATEPESDTE